METLKLPLIKEHVLTARTAGGPGSGMPKTSSCSVWLSRAAAGTHVLVVVGTVGA